MKTVTRITLISALFAVFAFAQPAPIGPALANVGWTAIASLPATTATLTPTQTYALTVAPITGPATYTTPTATALCSLFPFLKTGHAASYHWDWFIENTSSGSNTLTLAGGTSVTVNGTATVAQNAVKHFMVVVRNCGGTPSAVVYSLGSSTF